MSVMNSINTNSGAMVALQNLNSTNNELATVQKRVSTGERVSSAQDDGASFAIAQGLRSDIKGIGAVNEQISKAKGLLSTTITSLTEVSDGMADVRETLTKLADESVTGEQREQYQADLESKVSELDSVVDNAEYNGTNMINGDGDGDVVKVIVDSSGNTHALNDVDDDDTADFDIKTAIGDFQTEIEDNIAGDELTAADAQALLGNASGDEDITNTGVFTDLVSDVDNALNQFAADDRRLTGQEEFNSKLSDAIEEGLGATVDADLAKESARLQSLQTKQQLGTQTLSIANQSPQTLLSLFGG